MNSGTRVFHSAGVVTAITAPFSAWAIGAAAANCLLIASATRAEVAKSEFRSCRRTDVVGSTEGAARSTVAPFGTGPRWDD